MNDFIKSILSKEFVNKLKDFRDSARDVYRPYRLNKTVTRLLGHQYKRSHKRIEIDVTYVCNLECYQCNRSVHQAPSTDYISTEQIYKFIQDTIDNNIQWENIRLLGGEPTLHPKILDIIEILLQFKHKYSPTTQIYIITNGYGKKVNEVISNIPKEVHICNSSKDSPTSFKHYAFNIAPVDNPKFKDVDYAHGCLILKDCGIGLTPYGYYPCAVSGSIDRVMGHDFGRKEMPKDDDMMIDILRESCKYCGRFNHDTSEIKDIMSPEWEKAYLKYKIKKPKLDRY